MASLKSFIPANVLSAMVEEALRKSLVLGSVANTKYQGVIGAAGDSVLIPVIGDVTISDHTVNDTITYEALDSSSIKLVVDQQKRFSFAIDDVDSRQAIIDIGSAYADRAAYQLKDTADQYIASLHSQAGVKANLGTTAAPLGVTAAATAGGNVGVYEVLARIAKELDNKNVPQEGRWLVAPPWFISKLVLAGILTAPGSTDQEAALNGKVGYRMGFDIRSSTNVVNYNAAGSKIMAGTMNALSFVNQIMNVETLRLESKFGDGVRGLMVYGAKVVCPDQLAVATCSEVAG
jgi:hypothetical protein